MNEAETRAELIDPQLKASGWGDVPDSKILREFHITLGRIQTGGQRAKPEIADYILVYKNQKLAVVEAKSANLPATEGVTQAKTYAKKLKVEYTYSTNGQQIYEINMKTGEERLIERFPTPDELWSGIYADQNEWRLKFFQVPFEDNGGIKNPRYYQEIAVNKTMEAIAKEKSRVLLTLATGTGKTFIAFQIAWKLFQTRWNLSRNGARRPRILFLADRNILANQAFNSFGAFAEDALVRINPADIRKKGSVPTNGSIFFTIFQTFMSGVNDAPYFGEYPEDFFDLIIIDECHRGGANNEGNWRSILEYFAPAVQLGLTATPKRIDNVDTYKYFGEPVYIYSLKEGVSDGFLTPFKVKRIRTTLDEYTYTSDDEVIEGQVETGKIYVEDDFNRKIEIMEREAKRVKIMMDEINQNEKTIVFCANQNHALAVRDLINQYKTNRDVNYCVRVTANEGVRGDQFLREFQDNEKIIPTILTTSQKLSTGVDALNVRNIVLMRPVKSMIEFKQIIGRGTRLFEGKEYFTIYDFVDAYKLFSDPAWDGEPISELDDVNYKPSPINMPHDFLREPTEDVYLTDKILKIKLRDGKEQEIQHMISTSFYSVDGKPLSEQEFLDNICGVLPGLFKSEKQLREIWANSTARKALLEKLETLGYDKNILAALQDLVKAKDNDLLDVLTYISFGVKPLARSERVSSARQAILQNLDETQADFAQFVLDKYLNKGFEELSDRKLPTLLGLKYGSVDDAKRILGGVEKIRETFFELQKYLYINNGNT